MQKEKTKKLLRTFLRRLTNLSGNNRSVFLPRLSADHFIDLHELSFLNGKNSFSIIESLIAGKKTAICADLDSRLAANNEASKKLKTLQRLDRFLFEERGTKDLHVGWLFAHGKFAEGTLVRCPLVYFPVELVLENGQWLLLPRPGAEISFNKSFLLAYAFYNQTQPAEALLEEDFEDIDRDSAVFRNTIYQLLQKNNVEVNFNPDNYRDELIPFKTYKREELEELHENGRIKLFPEAVLGVFPQAGSSLAPDYIDLIENEKMTDLEEFFFTRSARERTPSSNFLMDVKEEKVHTVFPMDVWQENALKGVKLGHSLIVQGPPGTGKSQLIGNLISDTIANKKRVLLVCQKRVALDVVFNRLKEKRLDDFVGLVHDFKEDRRELYRKAARQIERIDEYKSKNNSLDAIHLERRFFETSRRIDQILEELEEFKKYLYDESDCGISPKQLYLITNLSEPFVELKQELPHFRWTEAEEFNRKLKIYTRFAKKFFLDEYPWKNRKSFAALAARDLKSIISVIQEVHPWFSELSEKINELIGITLDWDQCEELLEKSSTVHELTTPLADDETYECFQRMAHEGEEETSSLWLANMERVVLECFENEGPELSVPTAQLGQFQLALHRTMRARRNIVGLIRWELFSTDKFLIKRTLVNNELKSNRKGFVHLENMLDRRLNLEHNLSKLRTKAWLDVPDFFSNIPLAKHWFKIRQQAVKAKNVFTAMRGLKTVIDPVHHSRTDFAQKVNQLFRLIAPVQEKKEKWSQWLQPVQIRQLTASSESASVLEKTVKSDFDSLCDFDRLAENLQHYERLIIDKLYDLHKSWDDKELGKIFINSLGLAWIDHLELKHPELRIVSTEKIEVLEEELHERIQEKESISTEILLMRAREGVVDDLEFNRLNNRVTYRDLHHQLIKKKKIWPIRKVVGEYEEDIFRLLPCWMASPESVSSIFPMKEIFDLVIFDEASQCFAERGIPALYRARQVVIAGDHQQLQPFDLYQTRWEEESDDPDAESVSLLDLGNRYLLQVSLNSHYRSQSPDLIHFSNQNFYEGKLQLLPDRHKMNSPEPSIQYEKVEGVWENNCNAEEARKVAGLVVDITSKHPDKEIGVITFNAPQQSLILDFLDEAEREGNWRRPDSLIVKNIENVQGDEKDIIIFSIGYAHDKKGKLNAQFGSLNLRGGENRLNVAVTRAREKVIVVASIFADDLDVSETRNEGPKLLKSYLKYAFDIACRKASPAMSSRKKHESDWYLKKKILEAAENNFPAEEKFLFSDFVVRKNEVYAGLLLTDDELYYESPSAKSSHGLIPRTLVAKNWKYKMLYSRNWWTNRDKFWNELGKFILNQ